MRNTNDAKDVKEAGSTLAGQGRKSAVREQMRAQGSRNRGHGAPATSHRSRMTGDDWRCGLSQQWATSARNDEDVSRDLPFVSGPRLAACGTHSRRADSARACESRRTESSRVCALVELRSDSRYTEAGDELKDANCECAPCSQAVVCHAQQAMDSHG